MLVRDTLRHAVRSLRARFRNGLIAEGVGKGLRFWPGYSESDYCSGTNELPVQQALASAVKPGDVVYDIGANVGFFTVLLARMAGTDGQVHAFEPLQSNSRFIRKNARRNGFNTVQVHECAVADADGDRELWVARHAGGAALTDHARPPDALRTIVVRTVTVDRVIEEGLAPPAVVKIDVEGAEPAVLSGMSDTLRTVRPVVLYELDAPTEAELGPRVAVCGELLCAAGYTVRRLDRSYHSPVWRVAHFLAEPS